MNVLLWLGRGVLFLLVLSFSVRNTDLVVVRWLPGLEGQVPLVLALLCAFLVGLLLAWLILLPSWLRAQREASQANKALLKTERELKQDALTRHKASMSTSPPDHSNAV